MRLPNRHYLLGVLGITTLFLNGCMGGNYFSLCAEQFNPQITLIKNQTQSPENKTKPLEIISPQSQPSVSTSSPEESLAPQSKIVLIGLLIGGLCLVALGLWLFLFWRKSHSSSKQTEKLQQFEFTVVTVDRTGKVVNETNYSAECFTEKLGNGVNLELVYLPPGVLKMGARQGEENEREMPRHAVTLQHFLMGKYPVTQAQWKAVSALPKIKIELQPAPSKFKGDNNPVENVSWYEAVEFCQRLSQLTGREYRLPSEAEWEYACRANTKTPFYFGETITTDLANYKGIFTYAAEPKGVHRYATTPVGQFPPNAFGLYDLHGNVGEWCADTWHDNYEGAPTDGSAWIKNTNQAYRVSSPVRGGAWIGEPNDCRCAARRPDKRDSKSAYIGFRVVCEVGDLKG